MKFQRLIMVVGLASLVTLTTGYLFKGVHAHNERIINVSMDNLRGKSNLVEIAVIGSGPAGWDAALYGARTGYRVVVLTGPEPGGQLTKTTYVENFPGSKRILGAKIIESLERQARAFGVESINDTLTQIETSQWPFVLHTEDGRTIYAMTVIIATGASPCKLGIPGEEEYWGRGVTTCAICDAPFYRDKEVVVVGGGDSAVEEAIQLSAYARKITILVRKSEMRASHVMKQRLQAIPHIEVMYNTSIEKVIGNDIHVTEVQLLNNETKAQTTMKIDGVFLAIGHTPNTQVFKNSLAMDERGYIQVKGRSQETSLPGIFAAGDVEDDHYRQAGVAAASGIKAALDAGAFLTTIGLNNQVSENLDRRGAYFEDFSYEKIELKELVTVRDFETEVLQPHKIVLVDFYADYCPSCMQMLPAVQSIAQRFADQVTFYKVDVNAAKDLVRHLKVPKDVVHFESGKFTIKPGSSGKQPMIDLVPKVPCLLIYKDGNLVGGYNTALTRSELSHIVEGLLHTENDN